MKSPSQLLRERSSSNIYSSSGTNEDNEGGLVDPSPQHLPAHLPPVMDADLAETRGDFVVSPEQGTGNEEQQQPSPQSLHSSSSYSSSSSSSPNSVADHPSGNSSSTGMNAMSCVASAATAPISFWRGKKVSSTDVASVGNASDTGIPWSRHGISTTTTGRALHEKAKMALNAGNYDTALELFQAILQAQHQRFGKCHTSVAAAMHNVGGTYLCS